MGVFAQVAMATSGLGVWSAVAQRTSGDISHGDRQSAVEAHHVACYSYATAHASHHS